MKNKYFISLVVLLLVATDVFSQVPYSTLDVNNWTVKIYPRNAFFSDGSGSSYAVIDGKNAILTFDETITTKKVDGVGQSATITTIKDLVNSDFDIFISI
jgi:hypothetical protein